jgi:hypothetical protein
MNDPPPTAAEPQADQFPVAGDEVWIKAIFERVSHDGVYVRIPHPSRVARGLPWQSVVIDPAAVFAQLRVGLVLKAYGQ